MFETIVIRPNGAREFHLDYGQMIESMLYYDKTVVHVGRGELESLFKLADVNVLEELLKSPDLEVYFNNSHVGIINQGGILSLDSFGIKDVDLEKELFEQSFQYSKDEFKSKKFAKKISRLIKIYQLPKTLNKALTEQIKDENFKNKVLLETTKRFPLEKNIDSSNQYYNLEFKDDYHFTINTNIPFNKDYSTSDTPVLAMINCVEDLQVMSDFSSEISLPEYNSSIIRLKANSLLEKSSKSNSEIEVFNHYVYDNSRALREAINNKQILIRAILPILRNARKYKDWIRELPNDANLMREYQRKIAEKNILERLDFKAIRFYLFTGAAAILEAINPGIGGAMALGLNAFDTFLLDNIYKQWKPNQFVEGELRHLVKGLQTE